MPKPIEQPRPHQSNAIRKYRLLLRLHQKDLALRVGATQAQVSGWENGVVMPDLSKAIEIAVVLAQPVERVFFDHYSRAADLLDERGTAPGRPKELNV